MAPPTPTVIITLSLFPILFCSMLSLLVRHILHASFLRHFWGIYHGNIWTLWMYGRERIYWPLHIGSNMYCLGSHVSFSSCHSWCTFKTLLEARRWYERDGSHFSILLGGFLWLAPSGVSSSNLILTSNIYSGCKVQLTTQIKPIEITPVYHLTSSWANLHICSCCLHVLYILHFKQEGKRAFDTWNEAGHENSISSKETSSFL